MNQPLPPPPGDPTGRASAWRPPPPPTYSSRQGAPQPPAARRDGRLIAAGVMSVAAAALAGAFGVLALVVAIAADGIEDDMLLGTGDAWSLLFGVVALFLFIAATLALVAGIGCLRGRTWGRIVTLIVWGSGVGLMLLALANEPSRDLIVPLVWSGAIVSLAAAGRPWN